VAISNITMRNVSSSPVFIRLGSRMRAPEGAQIGSIKRISISNLIAYDADARYPSIISGIPGHDVEEVKLSGIRILDRGGVPAREPYEIPEREKEYPEPSMFGVLPAYGFFIRHAKRIELEGVDVDFIEEDRRPAIVLADVDGIDLDNCKFARVKGTGALVMTNATDVGIKHCAGLADFKGGSVARKEL
jgi:hypothetical protein